MKEIIVTGKSIKHMMQNKKAMKSGIKTSTLVLNRGNHESNNNYVILIIKTNKMFILEGHLALSLVRKKRNGYRD